MLPQKLDPDRYKTILIKRKWYVIIPLFITLTASAVYLLTAKRLYKATTLILVQRQTVPENYVSSTVTASIHERMRTIKEHITSRSNLEGLINKYDLYAPKNREEKALTIEEKVEFMRKSISIWVNRGASFSLSFIYSNPEKVMQVTNDLTTNFINENLMVREEQSVGTTQFLQNELDRIEVALKRREKALTDFQQEHRGSLPDQLSSNFNMLKQYNDKVASIEQRLDEARTQKIMLQEQIANSERISETVQVDQRDDSTESIQETFISSDITELKHRLKELQHRYTEKHPDVIKLKTIIARMEANQPELPEAESSDMFVQQLESLALQMASIQNTIKTHQQEKAELDKKIAIVTKRIEDTSDVGLELISLQRDYNSIRSQYNNLLAKKLQSELAESLEIRKKGEQFKIIDHAKLPEKPFKPNVPKTLLAGILVGLTAGLGLALGLEYMDKSFEDYRELSEFLQMPLLAVIPRIETRQDLIKKKRVRIFAYCLSGFSLTAVGIGVWFWINGYLQELMKRLVDMQ